MNTALLTLVLVTELLPVEGAGGGNLLTGFQMLNLQLRTNHKQIRYNPRIFHPSGTGNMVLLAGNMLPRAPLRLKETSMGLHVYRPLAVT